MPFHVSHSQRLDAVNWNFRNLLPRREGDGISDCGDLP
jgi:hypothetical protein